MGSSLFMNSLSKILLPLLIMLWLNGCMSVKTHIVGQTYQPLEPQKFMFSHWKNSSKSSLKKENVSNWPTSKLKIFPGRKIPWTSPVMRRQRLVQITLLLLPFIIITWEGIISKWMPTNVQASKMKSLMKINSSKPESRTLCSLFGF